MIYVIGGIVVLMVVATIVYIVIGNGEAKHMVRVVKLPTTNPVPILYWAKDLGKAQRYINKKQYLYDWPLEIITYEDSNCYYVVIKKESY